MRTWSNSNDKFQTPDNMIPFNPMNIKLIRNLWRNKTIYYESSFFGQEKLINKLDTKISCKFLITDRSTRDLIPSGATLNHNSVKKYMKK
jgi:hypothetical protein